MRPVIVKALQGVHMGLGHVGLAALIKREAKLDIARLDRSWLVLCLNTSGDRLKLIGGGGLVLGYLKMPKGQKIMLDALQYIPETFGGSGFDYGAACRKVLEKRLGAPKPTVS